MTIFNTAALVDAGRKNVPLRRALLVWQSATAGSTWSSIRDVRLTFPTADGIPVRVSGGVVVTVTCFNVKGNAYRLLTIINYARSTVTVVAVLTHAEYDAGNWKGRL